MVCFFGVFFCFLTEGGGVLRERLTLTQVHSYNFRSGKTLALS